MEQDRETPAEVKERISRMLTFISTLSEWFDQVKVLPKNTLVTLMKMGASISKFIPGKAAGKKKR